jgi:Protein of unknown function (DUF3800)
VILTAYCDESGTHDGSPITVMGGAMANVRQWHTFEKRFKLLRKKYGFEKFHTKKFRHKTGDFRGWSDTKCILLLRELRELSKVVTCAVSMAVGNADYEAEIKGGEIAPRKLRIPTKYGLCVNTCVYHFIEEAVNQHIGDKPQKLNFVLESGHKNAGDGLRIFNDIKAELKGTVLDGLLGSMTFDDKDKCDPLMMGDFFAHTRYTHDAQLWNEFPAQGREDMGPRERSQIALLRYRPGGMAHAKKGMIERFNERQASRPTSSM